MGAGSAGEGARHEDQRQQVLQQRTVEVLAKDCAGIVWTACMEVATEVAGRSVPALCKVRN